MNAEELQEKYGRALELHGQGLCDRAAGLYREILEQIPDADIVQYNYGLSLYALEQYEQAAAAFSAAAQVNPKDPDYWFNAGLALKQNNDISAAVSAYEKASALQPDDADILYNMACCYQADGDRLRAVETYEKVLALTEDQSSALSNMAYCMHLEGDYNRAAELYKRLLELRPDHVAARYMLDALEGKNSDAPPSGYVEQLFDSYSDNFDQDLVENLSYRVPTLLQRLLHQSIGPGSHDKRVLDLGCGTGLSGQAVIEYACFLSGVDLSAGMIREAEKKRCYDQLMVGDVIEYLQALSQQDDEQTDMLIAADVLTYLGDLEPLFQAAAGCARSGAFFCFSTEHSEHPDWQLRTTGRYGHHPVYVQKLAEKCGWQMLQSQGENLRRERDQWIAGDLYLLEKIVTNA